VALLAEVERAMGTLSGPATACVLRRQHNVFRDPRFERLGSISVAHLYNLRACQATTVGVRRAPTLEGCSDFIRIDSVHQSEHDGVKGLYHINAVDCVMQWQATGPYRLRRSVSASTVGRCVTLQMPRLPAATVSPVQTDRQGRR
jgi:hypothetical protein